MDIRGKSVLILGGYGLVGQAVARRLVREQPRALILLSLRREEAEEAVATLRAEGVTLPLEAAWGDVFGFSDVKDRNRRELYAERAFRERLIGSLVDTLDESRAAEYYLHRLITDLGRLLGAEGKAETASANGAAPSPTAVVPSVEGRWQGEANYPWGLRRSETFVFVAMGGTLAGTAGFLGVPRSIVEGAVDGTGVRFAARTREAAGSEERMATRRWVGRLNGDTLDLLLTTEGGFSDHEPVSMTLRRAPA